MVQSHVNELTTAATMLPAIRRTLEEFAVEINRLAVLVEIVTEPQAAVEAAEVAEAEGAVVEKTKTKKAEKTAELELGL